MTVITKELPKSILADRKLRDEDERVRFTLGIRLVGFRYGPYNTEPVELFQDSCGKRFIRESFGVFKQID